MCTSKLPDVISIDIMPTSVILHSKRLDPQGAGIIENRIKIAWEWSNNVYRFENELLWSALISCRLCVSLLLKMIEWTANRYEFQDKIALRWSMGASMWMDYLTCFTIKSCLLYVSWPLKTIGYATPKYGFHRINHTDNQWTPICAWMNLHWYIEMKGSTASRYGFRV